MNACITRILMLLVLFAVFCLFVFVVVLSVRFLFVCVVCVFFGGLTGTKQGKIWDCDQNDYWPFSGLQLCSIPVDWA